MQSRDWLFRDICGMTSLKIIGVISLKFPHSEIELCNQFFLFFSPIRIRMMISMKTFVNNCKSCRQKKTSF